MLTSLALVLLLGLMLGRIFTLFRLPGLLGMLAVGIALGPYALNWLDQSFLTVSPDLRLLALVIILTRAGLSIDVRDLRKVGRPAALMSFVPATCEIIGVLLIAPPLLGLSLVEAAVLGAVLAAVSPAIVVPNMVKLMEGGYGRKKAVPQLILAGASVDDIYVLVLFSSFVSLAKGGHFSAVGLTAVPVSILTGSVAGLVLGFTLSAFFRRFHMRDSVKVVIILNISLLLTALEKMLEGIVPFSGLLAVMCVGGGILYRYEVLAGRLAGKYSKLWVAAEVMLFVLVGATVDIRYAVHAGAAVITVILFALCFRMFGVYLSTIRTGLTAGERLFCMIAYLPKATVQAAIGGIPLAMGLPCGQMILTAAVLAILVTAPLGALGIELSYRKLLSKG